MFIIKKGRRNLLKTRLRLPRNIIFPLFSNPDAHITGIYFNTYANLISKEDFDENNLKDYIRKNTKEGKYMLIQFNPESLRLHPWVINIVLRKLARSMNN